MFLTASPLMGRWIVASCEIYVGIAELLLMAVVGQEVKVCNNNTSFEKSFCFKGQPHNHSTPVHSFQRVQEPVDGHVFIPDWETSTLLQSLYLLSQPAVNPDTPLPPELYPQA